MHPEEAKIRRRLLAPFQGQALNPPPIWLMRQAGRYLPEYRATRAKAGSFLDLCYSPRDACEVTLQPIRRFGFDAAILFSDILVVPHALGQEVRFVEGEGPRLDPIRDGKALAALDAVRAPATLARVYEAVQRIRQDLPPETALIGFCGAPWTVATYMVGGQGSSDQADARLWAYRDPATFQQLIDLLVEVSADYLAGQAAAGADVLQLFDTWAGALPDSEFLRWVIEPTRRIVRTVRQRYPNVPLIGFPRGAGSRLARYTWETGIGHAGIGSAGWGAIGVDTSMPLAPFRAEIGSQVVTQGNLDPLALLAGGPALDAAVAGILKATHGRPHIFNLGHGILPPTPLEHVERMVKLVRAGAAAC